MTTWIDSEGVNVNKDGESDNPAIIIEKTPHKYSTFYAHKLELYQTMNQNLF